MIHIRMNEDRLLLLPPVGLLRRILGKNAMVAACCLVFWLAARRLDNANVQYHSRQLGSSFTRLPTY